MWRVWRDWRVARLSPSKSSPHGPSQLLGEAACKRNRQLRSRGAKSMEAKCCLQCRQSYIYPREDDHLQIYEHSANHGGRMTHLDRGFGLMRHIWPVGFRQPYGYFKYVYQGQKSAGSTTIAGYVPLYRLRHLFRAFGASRGMGLFLPLFTLHPWHRAADYCSHQMLTAIT